MKQSLFSGNKLMARLTVIFSLKVHTLLKFSDIVDKDNLHDLYN